MKRSFLFFLTLLYMFSLLAPQISVTNAESDTTPPQLTVWPSDCNVPNSTVIVHGRAYDESGIQNVTVNSELVTGVFTSIWFFWQRAVNLTEGANTIIVVAYDNSSNHCMTTENRIITYQAFGYEGPTIRLLPPINVTSTTPTIRCIINPNRLRSDVYLWCSDSSWGNAPFNHGRSLGYQYSGTEDILISYHFTRDESLSAGQSISYMFIVRNSKGTAFTEVATTLKVLESSWTWTPLSIDGIVEAGEWPVFQELTLDYRVTYKLGRTYGAEPWDTTDKTTQLSVMNDGSHIYLCLEIPDDYLSQDFQIDALFIYLDDSSEILDKRHMLWDTNRSYQENSWITDSFTNRTIGEGEHDCKVGGTNDGRGQYSHTSGGSPGAEGNYTIELDLPLRAATGDVYDADAKPGETVDVQIYFAEAKSWTDEGYFNESSYWISKRLTIDLYEPPEAVTEWDITLSEGWNLISLPLIPENSSIEAVLADVVDNVTVVWSYNATAGTWLCYLPAVPELSELTEMVDGDGYWIKMKANVTLTVYGTELPEPPATPPVYHVNVGWNLIGFKSTEEMNVATYLTTIPEELQKSMVIYGWDATTQSYKLVCVGKPTAEKFTPGQGYWLYITGEADIAPPARKEIKRVAIIVEESVGQKIDREIFYEVLLLILHLYALEPL